ncbi:hypothetical protein FRC19_010396, partial [Serendipita sp. 401]
FFAHTNIVFRTFREQANHIPFSDKRREMGTLNGYNACGGYQDVIRKLLLKLEEKQREDPEDFDIHSEKTIMETSYTALALIQTLYLPYHMVPGALVGRELLHWLNSTYVAQTDEGTELLKVDQPWLDPSFWPFIKSCTVRLIFRPVTHYLKQLSEEHEHPATREIADLIVAALDGMPSSEDYDQDADFFDALRQWKTSLHRLTRAKEKHSKSHYEGSVDMEEIVSLIAGKPDALQRICKSCDMTWREAICVYGVWVHPQLTRNDLPDITRELLEEMPVDPTNPEEMLQAALFQADIVKAANIANDIDVWLVAHMIDLLEIVPLPESAVITGLRKYFLIAYAEHVMSDPSLWNISITYLAHCGTRGLGVANEILMRLPFRLADVVLTEESKLPKALARSVGDRVPTLATLNQILDVCQELRLKEAEGAIIRVASQRYCALRLYGKAVSYCGKTLDTRALTRVVHLLLNEYFIGEPIDFVRLVDQIPSQYLYPAEDVSRDFNIFTSRLRFPLKYAEHHYYRSRETSLDNSASMLVETLIDTGTCLAPETWWGLLLTDIGDLLEQGVLLSEEHMNVVLTRLEEVYTKSKLGADSTYLYAMMRRYSMKTQTEALQRLDRVRFILIQSCARAMRMDVGGKDVDGRLDGEESVMQD